MIANIRRTLDLRTDPPADQVAHALETFDALQDGEAAVFVLDHVPRALYERFTIERPDMFAWRTIEDGPLTWKVRLERRPPRCVEDSVEALLERDLEEIRSVLGFLREDLESACRICVPSLPEIQALFERCRDLLSRFLALQEDHFLPIVELENPRLAEGTGRILRLQLDEIPGLLARVERLLAVTPPTTRTLDNASETLREIGLLLDDVQRREEAAYVPAARESLDPVQRERLLGTIRML